jgi:TPR repeat protein
MQVKVAKGVSWLKTVMMLWAFLVGFKILAAFGQENTARGIVEAIFMFIGAFLITGIPAFILGWATGKDEPSIRNVSLSTALQQAKGLAERGDPAAQYKLGVMYADGQDVAQDFQEALKWFRLSAAQGNSEAQANLGALYHGGFGVQEDYVQAMMWFMIAKASGTSLADQNIQQLESILTPTQIANAQRMAQKWLDTHHSSS